ncbi:general stress protein 26 [Sphingobacterium allocomposti]|jgi:general stress protein 26|uniref:General stress protein 26 n=1 Tax=Sphingobacterium allocomposti TaxID=415956 RepID=A0A5S5DDP1_9SPHI|nr:pyridoxamine 5'-phosphate oxidase family protein [Sphingobacterium composti Yoo et al. 2007 non Ten et al. 2007]TYP94150.1 general stress protein 26 [Sphingobacterium composti Yoo et al. 2007 non Ten et al. 2007]HLS97066.1 pyridoxamine 5'-phosphate oxidase family protein [Sphingobacterium sp.]
MEQNNQQNLSGKEALAKIREIVDDAKTCFFCTDIRTGVPMSVRPMTVLQVDDSGYLWFMTAERTYKDDEIAENPFVHLLLQSGQRSGFLNLYGIAEIQNDRGKVQELWSPALEVWFEGPEDPQIVLIRVEVLDGHYWDNQSSAPVAAFKGLKSMITGKPDYDGVEGDIEI